MGKLTLFNGKPNEGSVYLTFVTPCKYQAASCFGTESIFDANFVLNIRQTQQYWIWPAGFTTVKWEIMTYLHGFCPLYDIHDKKKNIYIQFPC